MSLMTPDERARLPKGVYVKYKCDGCGKPISSPLTFTGPNGEDFCSRVCLERTGRQQSEPKEGASKMSAAAKSGEEKPKTKKKVKGDDEKELKSKKKSAEEDDEEEETESEEEEESEEDDEEEEEAPAKKSKGKSKVKSKKAKADDEDEDKPSKKSKKVKKAAPAKVEHSGKNPYAKPGSVAYEAFEMARKGTTVKTLNKFLEEKGVAPARIWRELKSKNFRDMKWKYIEDEKGNVQVKLLKAK